MEFSPQQAKALEMIQSWHARAKVGDAPQVFRLFGFAGTGKTTIAKEMRQFCGKVQYGSFTGKAALVLRGKGCDNARTIHSMIYRAMDKSKAERDALKAELEAIKDDPSKAEDATRIAGEINRLNMNLQQPGFSLNPHAFDRYWDDEMKQFVYITPPDLICIDECSMVDKRIGEDLESFKIPILVLGDPAQLPPVKGQGYFTEAEPDMLLTQIHRQAADNPILKIATACREGGMPDQGDYGDSRIVGRQDLKAEEWLGADQILCGMNATRNGINSRVRALKGYTGILPNVGERIVCLRNNHSAGLLNGSLWQAVVVEDMPDKKFFKMTLESIDDPTLPQVKTLAHKKPFMGEEFEDYFERSEADEFDFGHCLTTHKAQGSEWDHVIYIDQWPRPGLDKRRHQYTGVTRASKRITVVKW